MGLVAEILLALLLGAGGSIVGALGAMLLSHLKKESDTIRFEVRSPSGQIISTLDLPKYPKPGETEAAMEKVHEDERRLQHA